MWEHFLNHSSILKHGTNYDYVVTKFDFVFVFCLFINFILILDSIIFFFFKKLIGCMIIVIHRLPAIILKNPTYKSLVSPIHWLVSTCRGNLARKSYIVNVYGA